MNKASNHWISFFSYSWISDTIKNGFKRQLFVDDLIDLPDHCLAENVKEKFWKYCDHKIGNSNWKVLIAIYMSSFKELRMSALFMFIYSTTQLINPILLKELINSVNERQFYGIYIAIGFLVNGLVAAYSNQLQIHYSFSVGRKARALYMSLVYEHALSLSVSQLKGTNQGVLYNMAMTDAQRFYEISQHMNLFWTTPYQIIVILIYLTLTLGYSAFAGVGCLLLILPLNIYLASLKYAIRAKQVFFADSRVRLCSEIIGGIDVVKLFSWEVPYFNMIRDIRDKQLKFVLKELYVFALAIILLVSTPLLASVSTFLVFVLAEGRVLQPDDSFSTLAFFNVLKFPLLYLSQLLMILAQVLVAIDRLRKFLSIVGEATHLFIETKPTIERGAKQNGKYVESLSIAEEYNENHLSKPLISMKNANFFWSETKDRSDSCFWLKDITVDVYPRNLFMLYGPVGHGKSSFTHALIGEMYHEGGDKQRNTYSVAFCAQSPWIFHASIMENILFGNKLDKERFKTVLTTCLLWTDLENLQDREKTIIGERGVSLSGGQKARIALARAIYADRDLVILDDPLSSLDLSVGNKIFENLFNEKTGFLLNKSVLMSTNSPQHVLRGDKILVVFNGRIIYQGSGKELKNFPVTSAKEEEINELKQVLNSLIYGASFDNEEDNLVVKSTLTVSEVCTGDLMDENFEGFQLMTVEDRVRGTTLTTIIPMSIKAAGGYTWMIFVLFFMLCERLFYVFSEFWLRYWADAYDGPPIPTLPDGDSGRVFYSVGYVLLVTLSIFSLVVRCFTFVYGGSRAARVLFLNMLWRVMRSPMSFFDTTPIGRVNNRFSFDIDVVDDAMVQNLLGLVASLFWVISTAIVITVLIPFSAIVVVPAVILFTILYHYYRRACVELQRLDATTRSPVQTHFRESLDGLASIHLFGQRDRFVKKNVYLVNNNQKAVYAFVSANCWFGIRIQAISALITFTVSFCAWVLRNNIDPGLVGLAVLYSFYLSSAFAFFVALSTQAEAKMTSLERIESFTKLDQEADLQTIGPAPSKDWPSKGAIEFKEVTMSYRFDLPPALKNISFYVYGGEYVGVCGRTGSGKSSLSSALFRLREIEKGTITIDGIDIGKLGLSDFRGRVCSIITQDPLIFSGTIRSNLDPFNEFTDEQILSALGKAQLLELEKRIGGIYAHVSESGSCFSQGERQLLCLVRLLLRKPKVIFLDEMSSSMDNLTDEQIHSVCSSELSKSTIIEVAHRLSSIIMCSRIMVLSGGNLVEFDTPEALIQYPNGIFRGLVESNGPVLSHELRSLILKRKNQKNV